MESIFVWVATEHCILWAWLYQSQPCLSLVLWCPLMFWYLQLRLIVNDTIVEVRSGNMKVKSHLWKLRYDHPLSTLSIHQHLIVNMNGEWIYSKLLVKETIGKNYWTSVFQWIYHFYLVLVVFYFSMCCAWFIDDLVINYWCFTHMNSFGSEEIP